jgi:hypothetical protein
MPHFEGVAFKRSAAMRPYPHRVILPVVRIRRREFACTVGQIIGSSRAMTRSQLFGMCI